MGNAQVMVLGTFHFHQEGIQYLNIQSPERQSQIVDVVNKLSRFRPTKIAVELLPECEDQFNEKYRKYLQDNYIDLNNDINERIMLGFPLAKKNNIDKLFAINFMNEWKYDIAYASAESEVKAEIDSKTQEYVQFLLNEIHRPIGDIIKFENTTEAIRKQHSDMFLIMNQIGALKSFVGSDFISSWYERNLRIFANLQKICDDNDRIIIIYGAAHLATLVHFVKDYYKMDFISPLEYL